MLSIAVLPRPQKGGYSEFFINFRQSKFRMKLTLVFCLLSFLTTAQDVKKVMEPVHLLFDGMKKGDSAMVRRSFHSTLTFNTVTVDLKTNEPVLRTETAEHFLKAIGTPHQEVYNELIWSPKINVDGNFAQVWVNYAFFLGKTFSHCGVDAFQLFKDAGGQWKIFSVADTRHKTGCNVPKGVSDQLK